MTEISDATLETLRELEDQKQRARRQQQLILNTVLAEHGLDADTHEVYLEEGVIRKREK